MSATKAELEAMAQELYKELGGMRTHNGRVVRALLAKWKAAESEIGALKAEIKMNNEATTVTVVFAEDEV